MKGCAPGLALKKGTEQLWTGLLTVIPFCFGFALPHAVIG